MMPDYPNGAIALIRPIYNWDEGVGKVCAVEVEGEHFIKEVGDCRLISHNKKVDPKTGERLYPDIKFYDGISAHIAGEVVV